MAKVRGYYNINNGVFLGPMTAPNEATGVAHTPRYVEGVCFGEYNTTTGEFVPETNPMVIPKGSIMTQDDQFTDSGNIVTNVTGIVEDIGLDIARKTLISVSLNRTPGVISKTDDGRSLGDRYVPAKQATQLIGLTPSIPKVVKTKQLPKGMEIEPFDINKLFG